MPYAFHSSHGSSFGGYGNPRTGEVPYWAPPPGYGSAKPGTTPAAAPQGGDSDLAETLQAYAPTVQTITEWISGKWNKEERTAASLARANEGGGGFLGGSIGAQSGGPLGLPWIVWGILAAGGGYLLLRK